jgi:hypothetical protein
MEGSGGIAPHTLNISARCRPPAAATHWIRACVGPTVCLDTRGEVKVTGGL